MNQSSSLIYSHFVTFPISSQPLKRVTILHSSATRRRDMLSTLQARRPFKKCFKKCEENRTGALVRAAGCGSHQYLSVLLYLAATRTRAGRGVSGSRSRPGPLKPQKSFFSHFLNTETNLLHSIASYIRILAHWMTYSHVWNDLTLSCIDTCILH